MFAAGHPGVHALVWIGCRAVLCTLGGGGGGASRGRWQEEGCRDICTKAWADPAEASSCPDLGARGHTLSKSRHECGLPSKEEHNLGQRGCLQQRVISGEG